MKTVSYVTRSSVLLEDHEYELLRSCVHNNLKVSAIKFIRNKMNYSLIDAKNIIDQIYNETVAY